MYDAVVLGSGVLGLSIARELHQRGVKVAIVAKDLAEDSNSVGFASPWAGCNWFSFATGPDDPAAEWDRITYLGLDKLAKERPELCEKVQVYNVWERPKPSGSEPWFKDLVADFQQVAGTSSNPLPGNKPFGTKFKSYIIHAPEYTAYLGKQVRALGIPVIRARVSSLDEVYNIPQIGKVDLVINASGLGAKTLIGVEDAKVYPARGQTVLVKAPNVKECIMHTEGFNAAPLGPGEKPLPEPAYMIPRPGSSGHVVLGGHYLVSNYSTLPDLKEAERILKDCYNLCPALAGPNGKSWRDIEVVAHNVGLRPAREGGARIELEQRQIGQGGSNQVAPKSTDYGRKVAVVHAYGVGSAGFQGSLGIAEKASDLAEKYLKKANSSRAKL
ncbi:uncharacterized protein IL334_005750 [Kwoniella shivajii]|uniref:FAD dependent oxidoreductase domain-containing protein n=1 Tax=Kwoniella shivajii TaxID=564305 RepID=A0ABZ1D404_9TREE|nr:hypothetical protein IL334_005750 [Kwoniella shivajii]